MKKRAAGGGAGAAHKLAHHSGPVSPCPFEVIHAQFLAASSAVSGEASADAEDSSSGTVSSCSSPLNLHFAESCLKTSDSPPQVDATATKTHAISPVAAENDDDVTVTCETYTCVGGTWFGGNCFEPCIKKKMTNGVRHLKSQVCTIHHAFVKCELCSARVHEGCHVPSSIGYSLPQRQVPWKCLECTLKPISQAPDSNTDDTKQNDASHAAEDSDSVTSKCLFSSKSDLQETLRVMKWKIRSGTPRRIYCVCLDSTCKVRFAVKCLDTDTDGIWCAINMPSVHECSGGKRAAMPVTSRVMNLPIRVYQEIQQLACCKSFKPLSIQHYVKHKYGILVDTTLIYNIGYRARSKLGIGDIEQILTQQKVSVYTFSTPAT
jgi:hypothetical protein